MLVLAVRVHMLKYAHMVVSPLWRDCLRKESRNHAMPSPLVFDRFRLDPHTGRVWQGEDPYART